MNAETPRIYLTLRCQLACHYCSNGTLLAEYEELTGPEWESRIRFLPGLEVVLTGGEPSLHPDFYDIIRRVSASHFLNIYSNFKYPLHLDQLPAQPKGIHWRASCHAQTVEEAAEWIENVTATRHAGHRMTLTTVLCPDEVLEVLRPHRICVDPPQAAPSPLRPPVRCTLPRLLVAPDGNRYHCVGKLVRKDACGIVGSSDGNTIICQTPDRCAKCDSIASQRILVE